MADIRGTDIRQASEQGLMDMAGLISKGEYNLALVKGRQVAEQLIRGYAKENRLIYTDLADTIENLYGESTIGRGSRDAFHTIRQLGNKAVHENDNDPKDAENSYYLLKNEIEVYLNTEAGTKNRVPVHIDRTGQGTKAPQSAYNDEAVDVRFTRGAAANAGASSQGMLRTEMNESGRTDRGDIKRGSRSGEPKSSTGSQRKSRQSTADADKKRSKVPTREDRLRAQKQNQRGGTRRGVRGGGPDIYGILRILIPLLCIIVLIVLIRGCVAGSNEEETTTTPVMTESTAPAPTEPPTTEAPTTEAVPLNYVVTGDNVNVRYADNQNRIYEQLSSGTEIGPVEEIEGSDYVRFERDGIQLVIHKDYISPIE